MFFTTELALQYSKNIEKYHKNIYLKQFCRYTLDKLQSSHFEDGAEALLKLMGATPKFSFLNIFSDNFLRNSASH